MRSEEVAIKNVILYTRISTVDQLDGFSFDAQLNDLKKECEYRGYNIIGHYEDAGISGSTMEKRLGFMDMMKYIKKNPEQVDGILAWKLSRFSRNATDLMQTLEFMQKHDIHLLLYKDGISTQTEFGKAIIKLVGIFAEMERDNIITQVKSGMKQGASEGNWMGGTPPLGYDLVNKKLVINSREAEIVKTIFELYTDKRYGYSKLCQFLNKDIERYGTKKGNTWSYATLKQVLDNPVYNGKIRWGVHSEWNKKRRKGTKSEGDYVLEDGKHKAIIDDDLWERTRQRRLEATKQEKRKRETYHLLSGLAKCPDCGASMVSNRSSRTNKKTGEKVFYRYYVCNNWNNSKTCKPNSIKADILEQRVLNEMFKFVRDENLVKELETRFSESVNIEELEKEARKLENTIKELDKEVTLQSRNLGRKEIVDRVGEDRLLDIIESLSRQIETGTNELNKLRKQIQAVKENTLNYQKIAFMLKNFEKIFPKAEYQQQKDLLHSLIKEIKIQNNEDIDLRLPTEIILNFNEQDIMKFTASDTNSDDKSVWFICDTVPP